LPQYTTQSGSAPLTEASQSFEQRLVAVGKSVKTAKNYRQAVEGSISWWIIDAGLVSSPLSHSLCANTFDLKWKSNPRHCTTSSHLLLSFTGINDAK